MFRNLFILTFMIWTIFLLRDNCRNFCDTMICPKEVYDSLKSGMKVYFAGWLECFDPNLDDPCIRELEIEHVAKDKSSFTTKIPSSSGKLGRTGGQVCRI